MFIGVSPVLIYGPWSGLLLPAPVGRAEGSSQHGSHGEFSWLLDSGPWCTGLPVTRETLVTL